MTAAERAVTIAEDLARAAPRDRERQLGHGMALTLLGRVWMRGAGQVENGIATLERARDILGLVRRET